MLIPLLGVACGLLSLYGLARLELWFRYRDSRERMERRREFLRLVDEACRPKDKRTRFLEEMDQRYQDRVK